MRVLMISRSSLFSVPGGDTVQITETAKALRLLGVEVDIKLADEAMTYHKYDLIHFFNIIRPNSISLHVKKSGLPFVISTIFVDYTEIEQKYRSLPFRLLSNILGSDGVDYLKTLARTVINRESIIDSSYLWRGHKRSVEQLLNQAALLLPNSHSEFNRLEKRYRFKNDYICVPNAVSDDFFIKNTVDERKREGVVCVGRIEIIKNQLNLIKAINNTGISLKIVGKPAPNHQKYYEACKALASDNVEFLGQVPKQEVKELLYAAKVHVLPSFFETTGLSSLEAAALGCNVVITRKGDTEEYFKNLAFYCNPEDPASILTSIKKALDEPVNPALRDRVKTHYRWKITAIETHKAYEKALGLTPENETKSPK